MLPIQILFLDSWKVFSGIHWQICMEWHYSRRMLKGTIEHQRTCKGLSCGYLILTQNWVLLYSIGIVPTEAFIGFQPALILLCFHTGLSSHISIIPPLDNTVYYFTFFLLLLIHSGTQNSWNFALSCIFCCLRRNKGLSHISKNYEPMPRRGLLLEKSMLVNCTKKKLQVINA